MARIATDVTWLVGHTPLLDLARFAGAAGARLVGKLECHNPTHSNKDRAALGMVEDAVRQGFLHPGGTIVECSAGDTGLSLAMVAAARGYRLVVTTPAGLLSEGRRNLMRALGARVVLTPAERGMVGAMEEAERLAGEVDGALCLQPFTNRANARIHAETTAPEIWRDADGDVAAVVCPIGTGGTAAGCAAFFRDHAPDVAVIGVEPARCAVLSGGAAGSHDLPGLGAGFVPGILSPEDLREIIAVEDGEAVAAVRELARSGLLVGPASGAVAAAARRVAARAELAGRTVVAVLPDHGERYEDHVAFASQDGEKE